MPLVTIPLRLFGKSLKEYNFSVFTLPATFKPVEEFGMLYVYFYKDETTTRLIYCGKDTNIPQRLEDHERDDKDIIASFPQLFYPLMTRQFFCDFHEKSEDFCVS